MSGGQMQRVAIARALVNNPDILLADEPTGALDSATSVQIMEILKEISKDKLIIMVTHNPEIAETYSTRIIRLLDGVVVSDSNPCTAEEEQTMAAIPVLDKKEQKKKKDPKTKRTSMSFFTALSLSFNNLMTKKGRSFLTSFAGSIGIIGIALILAVSQGVQNYINSVQQETLTSYPIAIQGETADMTSLLSSLMSSTTPDEDRPNDRIYSNIVMYELLGSFLSTETRENDLAALRRYMEAHPEQFEKNMSALHYLYDISFDVYTNDIAGNTVKVDAGEVFSAVLGDVSSSSMMSSYSSIMSSSASMNIWEELIPGMEDENGNRAPVSPMLKEQYTLRYGDWPSAANEVVLIVNSRNELSDMALYALGLKDRAELTDMMADIMANEKMPETKIEEWAYEKICNTGLKLVLPTDYYMEITAEGDEKRVWLKNDSASAVANAGVSLKITGIVAPAEGSTSTALSGVLGYTYHLTDYVMENVMSSEIMQYQLLPENENYDVFTGLPFALDETNEKTDAEKKQAFIDYVGKMTNKQKYDLLIAINTVMPEEQKTAAVNGQMAMLLAEGATMENPIYDRAKMEQFVRDMYSQTGMTASQELVEKYIERLEDDELADMIRQAVETAVIEGYRMQATAMIEKQLDTITPTELAKYKSDVLYIIATREAKQRYMIQHYEMLTALPRDAYTAYLDGLSDEEIDVLMDGLLNILGNEYLSGMVKQEDYRSIKAASMLDMQLSMLQSDSDYAALYDKHMPSTVSESSLEENLELLGHVTPDALDQIVIYVETFDKKTAITDGIAAYNKQADEDSQINYTDYVALLMSGITTIIDAITYVLIAFVAISLVVSSIMIGIITYISVLERTKEIGILRAIGASKGNIASVFNAETLTIGFISGVIGIVVTLLLVMIVNVILFALTGIPNLQATLPWGAALILIGISMLLTTFAGLVPASIAAKKDPVVALRTE
ncbi:MAG: FtsX-like permease family protein [Clostridia bacterium]|nr:FtsX-like permease family protein [Clostridia bacterium]